MRSSPFRIESFPSWLAGPSLLLLALAAGAGWRLELEGRGRGWEGLAWLGYTHWAVFAGVAAFIGWAGLFAPVQRRRTFIGALITFALIWYIGAEMLLNFFFNSGPGLLPTVVRLGAGDPALGSYRYVILRYACPAAWAAIPFSFCFLCRLYGAPMSWMRAICSAALFVASWPLAVFVRGFFEDRGAADLLHALKSGYVVPFLIIFLGLPLLRFPSATRKISPQPETN